MQDNRRRLSGCSPDDIAIKSLFLGPQSENADWFLDKISAVLHHTFAWRKSRFPQDGRAISPDDMTDVEFQRMRQRMEKALQNLLVSLERETPKFTPRYIGHMVSEISLPALLAEFALLLHNPNNASREASRVGLEIEKSAIRDLAAMIGFDPTKAVGHFTSGGTLANFEGVWRALHRFDRRAARALARISRGEARPENFFNLCHSTDLSEEPGAVSFSVLEQGAWNVDFAGILGRPFQGPLLLVPGNKHYSWPKAAAVFGLGAKNVWSIALDSEGRLDVADLRRQIELARRQGRPIVAVISVAGTTELGEVDPIHDVQDVLDAYAGEGCDIWHHVDAAYGGFLTSIQKSETRLSSRTLQALSAIRRADSVTLDPHKLGYIPYACGAFISRDPEHYLTPKIDAPYLQQAEPLAPGWATTLEGSRSAAGAAAVWLTSQTIPFNGEGFGKVLSKTLEAKDIFSRALGDLRMIKQVQPSDTNVLCLAAAASGESLVEANHRTRALYHRIEEGPEFSVSRTELNRTSYHRMIRRLCDEWGVIDDGVSDLFIIRLVLMNPFIVSKETATDFSAEFKTVLAANLAATGET